MDLPDYSLPVHFRLPNEGVWVEIWFAGPYERWAYAKRYGDVWNIDSAELPFQMPVNDPTITHWLPAPPAPGEIDRESLLDAIAECEEIEAAARAITAPAKRLPRK